MPHRISDGKAVPQPAAEIGEERARELQNPQLRAREEQLEESAKRRKAEVLREMGASTEAHDDAVRAFDAQFGDVTKNPFLLNEVGKEYQALIAEAGKTGRALDFYTELPKIGERVRQRAGLPTTQERDRHEW